MRSVSAWLISKDGLQPFCSPVLEGSSILLANLLDHKTRLIGPNVKIKISREFSKYGAGMKWISVWLRYMQIQTVTFVLVAARWLSQVS